jgi:hypothetical protein
MAEHSYWAPRKKATYLVVSLNEPVSHVYMVSLLEWHTIRLLKILRIAIVTTT